MKLIHRSARAREAVRTVSTGGEVFVGAVVVLMLLAGLGDIIGPIGLGEAGMEVALFDMGGEAAVLATQHWSLVELMLAAGAIAFVASVVRAELLVMAKALVSALSRGQGKIPI
jgi:hypothetical protein